MKRLFIIAFLGALMFVMAGCGSNNSSTSSAQQSTSVSSGNSSSSISSSSGSTTVSTHASSTVSASSAASTTASSTASPTANSTASVQSEFVEWFNADSGQNAAQGAGLDTFTAPDVIVTNGTPVSAPLFSYLRGISQATYEGGAYEIIVRKGDLSTGTRIPGDSFDYKSEWKTDVNGIQVTCYGYADNQPTLIEWSDGTHAFSALYLGLGGDVMFFAENDISTIVQNIS